MWVQKGVGSAILWTFKPFYYYESQVTFAEQRPKDQSWWCDSMQCSAKCPCFGIFSQLMFSLVRERKGNRFHELIPF